MIPVEPITMQSLNAQLGEELAVRSCAPVAFYMLLKANGYLDSQIEPDQFVFDLSRAHLSTDYANPNNWSRPAVTKYLRHKYNAAIVSWWLNDDNPNIERMRQAGYVETEREEQFLREKILGKTLPSLVTKGHPVIVTAKEGFNGHNKSVHAVILLAWKGNRVTVVDPDARNIRTHFSEPEILANISPTAAGSIVLPPV
jgi:hypothetical protein